jgi:hypothetical protein
VRKLTSFFAFLVLVCFCVVAYNWSSWLDSSGVSVTGTITEKRETIRTNYADWFRRFEVVAGFRVPGSPVERSMICDLDEETFNSLHIGQTVTVHVVPGLMFQPFVPSSHLSICPRWGMFGFNSEFYRRSLYLYGSLAIIVVAALFLRIRLAWWLLIPWSALFVVYGICPHAEPAPTQPRPAMATVKHITTIVTIMESRHGSVSPLQLTHPYQLVQLVFTPTGQTDPVVALDAIDPNSAPGVQEGRTISIEYDATNPRVARIPGATRNFPQQALRQIGTGYLVIMGLLAALLLFAGRRSGAKTMNRPRRRL